MGFESLGLRCEKETAERVSRVSQYIKDHMDARPSKPDIPDNTTLTPDEWDQYRSALISRPKQSYPFTTVKGIPIPSGSLRDIVRTNATSPAKIIRAEMQDGRLPRGIYDTDDSIKPSVIKDILEIASGGKTHKGREPSSKIESASSASSSQSSNHNDVFSPANTTTSSQSSNSSEDGFVSQSLKRRAIDDFEVSRAKKSG